MVYDGGIIHQILATTCVLCNGFTRGMVTGWVAPTLIKLKQGEYSFSATDEELSWVASAHSVGRFFGPLLLAVILDRAGRKFSIIIGFFSFLILSLVMIFVRSIIFIFMLRLLMGAIQGMFDVVNFIYLAENCSPKMRGIMGSVTLLSSNIGSLVENVLVAYVSYSTASVVNAIICLCLAVSLFFTKETPYFLVMNGRYDEAMQNLLWLKGQRTADKNTIVELDKIQQNMQSEMLKKRSLVTTLKSPENYRPVLIMTICLGLLLFSGTAGVGAYASMIFLKSSILSSKEFTILMVIFDLLGSFIFPLIVEKYNRRTLLQIFLLIIIICHGSTFILYSLELTVWMELQSWMIFTSVTLMNLISGWAIYTLSIMRGELLPMSVKGVGSCIGIMVNSFICAVSTAIFWPIWVTFGIQYNFLLFMISSTITFIIIFKMLPETKGKTLVDIQLSLQSNLLKK